MNYTKKQFHKVHPCVLSIKQVTVSSPSFSRRSLITPQRRFKAFARSFLFLNNRSLALKSRGKVARGKAKPDEKFQLPFYRS